MNNDYAAEIFELLAIKTPSPSTELVYNDNYTLLVAVILSAQSTDVGVNRATKNLFQIASTPKTMVELGLNQLKSHIRTLGLYNAKAANIIKMSQMLIDLHQNQVPNDYQQLIALPGVGRKTANVVLNTAFGHATIAVDTHIFRLSNRLDLAPGSTPLIVEKNLLKVTPKEHLKNAHHLLILHGRYVCKARKPNCHNCVLNKICRNRANFA